MINILCHSFLCSFQEDIFYYPPFEMCWHMDIKDRGRLKITLYDIPESVCPYSFFHSLSICVYEIVALLCYFFFKFIYFLLCFCWWLCTINNQSKRHATCSGSVCQGMRHFWPHNQYKKDRGDVPLNLTSPSMGKS